MEGKRFALLRECPHLRIEIWDTRFWDFNLDAGDPFRRLDTQFLWISLKSGLPARH